MQKDICQYRKRRRRHLSGLSLIVLFLIVSTFVVACGGKKNIHISMESSKFLNLDDSGAPLPVIVRVYQLKNKENMEKADFLSLWKSDKDILGEDLLDRSEVTLLPESTIELNVESGKDAGYLAVMVLFRKPQGGSWRQIIPLKESRVHSVKISVHERSLKIINVK